MKRFWRAAYRVLVVMIIGVLSVRGAYLTHVFMQQKEAGEISKKETLLAFDMPPFLPVLPGSQTLTFHLLTSTSSFFLPTPLLAAPFAPGDTLDPGCSPGDVDCYVEIPPAGSDGQVQYNNGGSFGGASTLFFDDGTNYLGVNDNTPSYQLDVNGIIQAQSGFRTNSETITDFTGVGLQNSSGTLSLDINGLTDLGGAGTSGDWLALYDTSAGAIRKVDWDDLPAGGGSPGGSNTQLQFNNSSSFGGTVGLTWDSSNRWLGLQSASGSVVIDGDSGVTGETRGTNALDIQSDQTLNSQSASGSNSVAIGLLNTSSGLRSLSFGHTNTVSSQDGSAFGVQNSVTGLAATSSAVGYLNSITSSGSAGNAFGSSNTVSGPAATAVGYGNTAEGSYSTAAGYSNTTDDGGGTANRSAAMGTSNTASANYANAFGYSNTASAVSATAFGYLNEASNSGGAAFGYTNTASGNSSSAFGNDNNALNLNSSAFGRDNTSSGDGASTFGFQNTASATYATAIGSSVTNSTAYSVAIGPSNTAKLTISSAGAVGFANGAFTFPTSDGTDGQVLTTDGSGSVTWEDAGGGGGSSTLADIATNSTSTAHQTFALNSSTDFIIENSSGTDIVLIDEATGDITLGASGSDHVFTGAGNFLLEGVSTTNIVRIGADTNAGLYFSTNQADHTSSDNSIFGIYTNEATAQVLQFVGDNGGNQVVFTNVANRGQDHDHTAQTNPTVYIHSDTAPNSNNTQWLSFAHNQTNAVFGLGTGGYTFPDGNVSIGTSNLNGALTVEGVIALDEISAPSNTAGYGKIYVKSSDSLLYFKDDGGTEYDLTAGAGGGSGTVNSGTAGYLAYYPSTGTTVDDSGLYWDSGDSELGIGTTTPNSSLVINRTNSNYTNTDGEDSHILMTNSSVTGQNSVSSYINGSLSGKWRSDSSGNLNWVAAADANNLGHIFFTGGDHPTGDQKMKITNAGVSIGDNLNGVATGNYFEVYKSDNSTVGIGVSSAGTLTTNAGAVFNEGSIDADFRIEGNGEANLFFADAGNDRIGIGTNTPAIDLDIVSDSVWGGIQITNSHTTTGPRVTFINDAGELGYMDVHASGSGYGLANAATFGGENNVIIGADSQVLNGGSSSIQFRVGGYDTDQERMRITASGYVGVDSLAGASANDLCYDTTTISGLNTFATCSSSERYKKSINDLPYSGLDAANQLRPVEFTWKKDGVRDFGFIAEEAEAINPLFATYANGQIEGVKYKQLVAVAIKAIQELDDKVDEKLVSMGVNPESTVVASVINFFHIITKKITTNELCIGDTCITEDELKELLENSDVDAADNNQSDNSSGGGSSDDGGTPSDGDESGDVNDLESGEDAGDSEGVTGDNDGGEELDGDISDDLADAAENPEDEDGGGEEEGQQQEGVVETQEPEPEPEPEAEEAPEPEPAPVDNGSDGVDSAE